MIGEMILGHLVGDYLLQPQTMAINKGKSTKLGWAYCFFHCLIYTTSILIFVGEFSFLLFFLIFLTHFPIDKFSLAQYLFKGLDFSKPGHLFLYAVKDNTIHLVLMYLVLLYVGG